MRPPLWTLLVPLKQLSVAKRRLRGAVPGLPHEELVLAVAAATVAAALDTAGVGRLIVVTGDRRAGAHLRRLGADVQPDRVNELNAVLAAAAATVRGPVAAIPADLPALRPAELAEALLLAHPAANPGRAFVPDADGTGTVLLATGSGEWLDPRFGPDSAARHELSGARRLAGAWPSLRRDVDTARDLREAAELGWQPPTAIRPREASPGVVHSCGRRSGLG